MEYCIIRVHPQSLSQEFVSKICSQSLSPDSSPEVILKSRPQICPLSSSRKFVPRVYKLKQGSFHWNLMQFKTDILLLLPLLGLTRSAARSYPRSKIFTNKHFEQNLFNWSHILSGKLFLKRFDIGISDLENRPLKWKIYIFLEHCAKSVGQI